MNRRSRRIYINYFDLERLKLLLKSQGDLQQPEKAALRDLAEDLQKAVAIAPEVENPYMIMLNSNIRLKNLETGEVAQYQLVFPGRDAKGLGKLSVLSPVGAAILGRRELDTLTVVTPSGTEHFRVEEIIQQPEQVAAYL